MFGSSVLQGHPIADDVSQSCLLGADFLVPHGAVIDFKTNQLQVGEAVVPMHHSAIEALPKQVCRVSVATTAIIRGGGGKRDGMNFSQNY